MSPIVTVSKLGRREVRLSFKDQGTWRGLKRTVQRNFTRPCDSPKQVLCRSQGFGNGTCTVKARDGQGAVIV